MVLGVVIAAGGVGSRMGLGASKQLMELAGRPVLAHTVGIFEPLEPVAQIVIAIDQKDILHCRMEVVDRFGFGKVRSVVPGGANRAQSVKAALAVLDEEVDVVAVHDGARPLFSPALLESGLHELTDSGVDGVVFALPVTDTIKEVEPDTGLITGTPDRSRLWAAQTPQIFRREALEEAHAAKGPVLEKATDDAFLVERSGGRVRVIPGSRENIKLTEPLDVMIAEGILRSRTEADGN